MLGGLAGWLWFGPTAASARVLVLLGGSPDRWIPRRLWFRRTRPGKEAAAWRSASIELCQGIVAELTAGRTPGDALARAISSIEVPDPAALNPVAAAARDGGDIAAALRRAAPPAGGEGLIRLASCWQVSVTVGGGLASLIERTGSSLREAEAHRQDVFAQLAGPRATARLLAFLPALGLLMAGGLGMQPFPFLFGTPAGFACLAIGLTLDATGLWWTNRLVRQAEAAGT
ncbi:type II secretion system F family protein [Acrocarpospora corrugata]|nr:type II secretion system F family protein [Acrocarpospora corrugata]